MKAAAFSSAILLAGGSSNRMKSITADKILAPLGDTCAFTHCLRSFRESEVASHYVVAYRDDVQRRALDSLIQAELPDATIVAWARGGDRRQDSVWNALQMLDDKTTHVFIHDCARPLIRPGQLAHLLKIVCEDGAVCLASRITDTIKMAPADHPDLRHMRLETVPRNRFWSMETPQVFDRKLIVDAYRLVLEANDEVTDDAAAVESFGHTISLYENRYPNLKLTRPGDLELIQVLFERQS
jgi:2-C-methyl-D-erythritol 4-phosphate cytidylyltransferase